MLAHHVYFTLHDSSPAATQNLVEACHQFLSGHPGIVYFNAGPRKIEFARDVNDLDFEVALSIVFADDAAHEAYQSAPRHAEFIGSQQSNWKRVRVFDSVFN